MATYIWINIGLGNNLSPDGTKPLLEPMLTLLVSEVLNYFVRLQEYVCVVYHFVIFRCLIKSKSLSIEHKTFLSYMVNTMTVHVFGSLGIVLVLHEHYDFRIRKTNINNIQDTALGSSSAYHANELSLSIVIAVSADGRCQLIGRYIHMASNNKLHCKTLLVTKYFEYI